MLASVGLAAAHARRGVRVNVINPGLTLTGRAERACELEASRLGVSLEEARRSLEMRIPLGRFARPEEIAAVAVFLASDRASYVTGAVLSMDGAAAATVV
jgi:NAD(P)-dependent dehydrogenase (short-subunit alcohol dehydrogenase family)